MDVFSRKTKIMEATRVYFLMQHMHFVVQECHKYSTTSNVVSMTPRTATMINHMFIFFFSTVYLTIAFSHSRCHGFSLSKMVHWDTSAITVLFLNNLYKKVLCIIRSQDDVLQYLVCCVSLAFNVMSLYKQHVCEIHDTIHPLVNGFSRRCRCNSALMIFNVRTILVQNPLQ